MVEARNYQKRGYLKEPFRLFHLRDIGVEEMEYHYHEFDKVVFFLEGEASYIIEGRSYTLQPWDVLLVGHHMIHKPVIDPSHPYERIVLYLDPALLSEGGEDLSPCFQRAVKQQFALMRPRGSDRNELERLLTGLEDAMADRAFASELLARTWLLQLLIWLNRLQARDRTSQEEGIIQFDPKIARVLAHINTELSSDLSVDALANLAYTSKYHFMRLFREQTGYSVHQYVNEKRLLAAAALLREGVAAQEAALRCGFQDYSTFHRAFKRQFGVTPRQAR